MKAISVVFGIALLVEWMTYEKEEGGVCRTSVVVMSHLCRTSVAPLSHLSVGSEQSETTDRSVPVVLVASFRRFLKITFYYITIVFDMQ